jgi:vacuolar protein sorting-associated protein 13A/C
LGKTYVKLVKVSLSDEILVRIDILLQDATVFIVLSKEETIWPYRIDNTSSTDVIVYQAVSVKVLNVS